ARSPRYHGLPVPSTMRALRNTRSYGASAACTGTPMQMHNHQAAMTILRICFIVGSLTGTSNRRPSLRMVEPADYPAGRTVRKRHRDKCSDSRKWPRYCIGDHPAAHEIRWHDAGGERAEGI